MNTEFTSSPMPEPRVDQVRIDRNWMAISTELFAPQPSRLERLLRRLSVPGSTARLMVATPSLRRAWFVALGLVVLIGLAAGDGTRSREDLFMLLLLAPLVPVLGISLAYGVDADPAYESSLATPLSGFRLMMIRATTIVALSVVVLAVVSLINAAVTPMAFGWLLPSLGLTSVSLALMTFTTPRRAGAITALVWVAGVALVRGGAADPLAAFTLGSQLLMVAVGGVALLTSYKRREHFDLLEVG
jgi:hypothetical protein